MLKRLLKGLSSKVTPERELTEGTLEAGLHSVIKDGIATQAMMALTSGVLLIDFALSLRKKDPLKPKKVNRSGLKDQPNPISKGYSHLIK